MTSGIARKITILLLIVAAGALVSLAAFYWVYTKTTYDTHFINIAGRQRMLAQRIQLQSSLVERGQRETRLALQESIAEFQTSLDTLEYGGQVQDARLHAAPMALKDRFALVRRLWDELEAPLRQIAEVPSAQVLSHTVYKQIGTKIPELITASDRIVTSYIASVQDPYLRLLYLLGIVTSFSVTVLLLGLWFSKRYIVVPILMLTDGVQIIKSGHFGHQVHIRAWDELAILVECFNNMSASLAQLFAQVRSSEQRYHDLVNDLDAIVWEQDPRDLRMTFVSRHAETLLGYPTSRWLAEPEFWKEIVHPDDREGILATYSEMLALRSFGASREYRAVSAAGCALHLHSSWRATMDTQGQIELLRGITTDVTERKQIEEQLRQAHKMEAVGMLAGGVAHDFNNLLTVIQSSCDLALLLLEPAHSARRHVGQVVTTAGRAGALTRQLLAFSRRQTLAPKVLDLNAIVAGMDDMLRRLIGEHIALNLHLAPNLGHARADSGQMEQTILNLAANARAAMPLGGRLIIETANVEFDKEYAGRHADTQPGRYVLLALSDTGCGMDAATRSRIFDPFFTTKQRGQGTGLGLSIVYGIVKQSGGNIWVYSEPGLGTTFKIYLPRVDEPAEHPAHELAGAQRITGSETVLLVEDEEAVRSTTREILELNGYTVLDACDGAEALRICEQHLGAIDLVITDVIMPGLSGPDLAGRITGTRPTVKVLYVSGYPDDVITHQGLLRPGNIFLEKPYPVATLLRKVREVLDGQDTSCRAPDGETENVR